MHTHHIFFTCSSVDSHLNSTSRLLCYCYHKYEGGYGSLTCWFQFLWICTNDSDFLLDRRTRGLACKTNLLRTFCYMPINVNFKSWGKPNTISAMQHYPYAKRHSSIQDAISFMPCHKASLYLLFWFWMQIHSVVSLKRGRSMQPLTLWIKEIL